MLNQWLDRHHLSKVMEPDRGQRPYHLGYGTISPRSWSRTEDNAHVILDSFSILFHEKDEEGGRGSGQVDEGEDKEEGGEEP